MSDKETKTYSFQLWGKEIKLLENAYGLSDYRSRSELIRDILFEGLKDLYDQELK